MDATRLQDLQVGVATSAYQIEGAVAADGRGPSIWDVFCRQPGAIADGSTGDDACEHYDRLEDDLDLLAWLDVDAYRFSIAWPRVHPDGRGRTNAAGLGFYDRLVDGLLERGIAPMATLYHWDLPAALQDAGGWAVRDTAGRFADYAEATARVLGDRVASWATLNEPWCAAHLGHQAGVHAPGVRDDAIAVAAAHHLLLAHGLGVEALRGAQAREVGIVINPAPVWPASDEADDQDAARLFDGVLNRWWLDAVVQGRYPSDVLEAFAAVADLSVIREGDPTIIGAPLDWLGVNFYRPERVAAGGEGTPAIGPALAGIVHPPIDAERTQLDWPIHPPSMTDVLRRIADDYGPLPLWITENGAAFDDAPDTDGAVRDDRRVDYLDAHLSAALDARDAGVDLRGYLVWSLLDNFEWAEGYVPRFGIVHVDYDTQRRTPKTSAHWLRDLLAARGA
ncbi:MAG TPA: GH1 family beta-glucosidase [Euzebyales bacterium]